ncbi:MAG: hypothetical protein RL095_654 [Verrucomicrobiota bacterium]|jgi:hypothetical protein
MTGRFLAAAAALVLAASTAAAAIKNDEKTISTVIVTGNTVEARLLAELIQRHTKQPILYIDHLKPRAVSFVPAQVEAEEDEEPVNNVLLVETKEYSNFINFAHPEQVVFLGNPDHTPKYFKEKLNPAIKSYAIDHRDWMIVASQAEELFGISGLLEEYKAEREKLEKAGVKFIPSGIEVTEPKPVLPPAAR